VILWTRDHWRLRKSNFEARQTTGHANKERRSFTAHDDRMDPAVNNDIRLGWYSILTCEKKFRAFSRSGTLFHMCEHLTKQWSSGLVRRAFRLELGPCALLWHNRFSEQRSFICENKMSWKVVKVYLRSI